MISATVAALGLALSAALIRVGRRDLTHPAVAFGMVWFLFAAVAQLRLTSLEQPWSAGFAAMVLVGGLLFAGSAFWAAGVAPLRGVPIARPTWLSERRLLIAIAVLIAGAVAGTAWKASILGGVPLFSGDIDNVRARAYGEGGESAVPAPSTFLTNGFHLAAWCLLVLAWRSWRDWSVPQRLLAMAVLAACLVGSLAGGSRNVAMFAVAIPLLVAYVATPRLSRRWIAFSAVAATLLVAFFSVTLALRADERAEGGQSFLAREASNQPLLVRPALPVYIAGAYPLEALRRVVEAFPERFSYGVAGYSFTSLPDKAFPHGKPDVNRTFGTLNYQGPGSATWTVASYQGRAYADLGAPGVLLASILLGILLGLVYRVARERPSLVAVAAAGYGAYYAAFMLYDNFLSFTLVAVYDLAVLTAVLRLTREAGAPAQGTSTVPTTG